MRASAPVAVVLLLTACGSPTATPLPSAGVHTPGPLGDTWTGDGTTWQQIFRNLKAAQEALDD